MAIGWSEMGHQQLLATGKGRYGRTPPERDVGGVGELLSVERDVFCRSWGEENVGSFPRHGMKSSYAWGRATVTGNEAARATVHGKESSQLVLSSGMAKATW